jgi:hypothetical protein
VIEHNRAKGLQQAPTVNAQTAEAAQHTRKARKHFATAAAGMHGESTGDTIDAWHTLKLQTCQAPADSAVLYTVCLAAIADRTCKRGTTSNNLYHISLLYSRAQSAHANLYKQF